MNFYKLYKKINKLKVLALDKEKLMMEDHKNEMERVAQKSKAEIEKIRSQYYEDLRTSADEYENKLTDLRIKYIKRI